MATNAIVQRGNQRVKLRSVAPGEVELTVVGALQFIVSAALIVAPPRLLRGNGTALLTLSNYPDLSQIVKSVWALIFFSAGLLCARAVMFGSISARKGAWQLVIPLWACWLSGLIYPLVVGQPTNVITLSAV